MIFLYDVLVAIGGLFLLWLIFRLFGGCLLRVVLFIVVLGLGLYVMFYVIGC